MGTTKHVNILHLQWSLRHSNMSEKAFHKAILSPPSEGAIKHVIPKHSPPGTLHSTSHNPTYLLQIENWRLCVQQMRDLKYIHKYLEGDYQTYFQMLLP